MSDLKKTLESLDFTDVTTLLNSGNVVFQTEEKDTGLVTQKIEKQLEKTFSFFIRVMVRTSQEIKELVASDPFKNIPVTPETRLYVTFLVEEGESNLKIPYESPEKDFGILQVSKDVICSYLILSPKRGTVDLMSFIGKEFSASQSDAGKNATTRNWNTVVKLAAL